MCSNIFNGTTLSINFGINLEILPVSGWGQLQEIKFYLLLHWVSPAAYIARLSRGGMLEM